MTQSVIGSNAAIRYLKSYQAHLDYWHLVNPTFQLAYVDKPEHVPFVQQYMSDMPNSMVVARIRHPLDGGFHLAPTGAGDTRHYVSSPKEYHDAYGALGRVKNGILNVMNEPNANGTPDDMVRLVTWMTDYINLAIPAKTKSVLFNWADRNPRIINGMLDGQFDSVLLLMGTWPELFYMGFHFYGPDNITDVMDAYLARCKVLKIVSPRVIGTEFGIDSIGGTQRGYKTWPEYKDSYAQWQESQVHGALAPYLANNAICGLCVFQEGNSGGWDDMDFENDTGFKTEIKRASLAGELSPRQSMPTVPSVTVSLSVLQAIRDSMQSQINVVDQLIKTAK